VLDRVGLPILGSPAQAIDIASARHRFEDFLSRLGIPQPPGGSVTSVEEALQVAQRIGYPVLVRPSYVLGGRAMEIIKTPTELVRYLIAATEVGRGRPVLIDRYLEGREVEVDALCDGEDVLIPGIMEHVERAGVHSGDSMAIYPGLTLSEQEVETLVDYTVRIGRALGMNGLMNVQYVIFGGKPYRSPSLGLAPEATVVYVLEVNPRASRTVPFLSKATGVPIVRVATKIMLGRSLREQGYATGLWKRQRLVAVKAPVFSMSKLTGVDTYLGPEMKSTGEVMGVDYTFTAAVAKALLMAGLTLPPDGGVLLSIADRDKAEAMPIIRMLAEKGRRLYATEGTAAMIQALGIPVTMISKKLGEGHPDILDLIRGGMVQAVINTMSGEAGPLRDGFEIRRAAVERRIPCFTSLDTARAVAESLSNGSGAYSVRPHLEYLRGNQETAEISTHPPLPESPRH